MPIDFFRNCTTDEERKSRFRELSRKYHPDFGGEAEIFMEVKRQYDRADKSNGFPPIDSTFVGVGLGDAIMSLFGAMLGIDPATLQQQMKNEIRQRHVDPKSAGTRKTKGRGAPRKHKPRKIHKIGVKRK